MEKSRTEKIKKIKKESHQLKIHKLAKEKLINKTGSIPAKRDIKRKTVLIN